MVTIGLVGLGVMGGNLALNFAGKGYQVVVYNRTRSVTDEFVKTHRGSGVRDAASLQELAGVLERPRIILLMVTAGPAVDSVVNSVVPYLEPGDVLVDLGNSHFKDTARREKELQGRGVHFCGVGLSGGEEGALHGPSIMAGGQPEAWKAIEAPLKAIAASSFDGSPCAAWMGDGGAGHYVKMVHNAIEYVVMELLAECYGMMKASGMSNGEISDRFAAWNSGPLKSYLVEIASRVLRRKDDLSGGDLVDKILDSAEQKGTGRWAAESCLELGVPSFSFAVAALDRSMSSLKQLRLRASSLEPSRSSPPKVSGGKVAEVCESALRGATISAYSQGFSLLEAASSEYGWGTDLAEVARIWQGGCIVRAELLKDIRAALLAGVNGSLMTDTGIHRVLLGCDGDWRDLVAAAVHARIPVPGFSSTLAYRDSLFTGRLPANLIQGLRDYFGAHTYSRTDREGTFHTRWTEGGS